MPSVQMDIDIQRSPEEVFDFLADFGNDARWRANVVEMKPLGRAGDLGGVWSRQIEVRKVPGRVIETEAVVVACERPTRLAVGRASGPVRPLATYTLARTDGGGTRLSFRLEVRLAGAAVLAWPVVALLVAVVVKPAVPKDLARLRQLLEAAADDRGVA